MFTRRKRLRRYDAIIEEKANAAYRRFIARPAADDETLNEGDIDDREDLWEDE